VSAESKRSPSTVSPEKVIGSPRWSAAYSEMVPSPAM
jgi:hypothetical protein